MKRVWAFFLWIPVLAAQAIPGRYIVELTGESAATYAAARRGGARAVPMSQALDEGRAIVHAQQARIRPEIEKIGARVVAAVDNIANALIVRIPDAAAARLASVPGVAGVYPVVAFKANLDGALPIHKVPDAWTALGGKEKAGAGMKVAVIDTGIDNTHAGFKDDGFTMPAGFPKTNAAADEKFTSKKIIVVRNYVDSEDGQDHVGHGTAVAMEAAGVTNTSPIGPITGVAPGAWLGSYKTLDAEGHGRSDALTLAFNDAVGDGMDVINLSQTTPVAQRIDQDFVVRLVERAAIAGIVVVVSAGNEGFDGPNAIGSPATAPSALAVGATYNSRVFVDAVVALDGTPKYVALPGNGPQPSDAVSAGLTDVTNIEKSGQACGASLAGASLTGAIALISRGNCTFEEKINNAQAAGAIGALIYNNTTPDEFVRMNVGSATLPAMFVTSGQGQDIKKQLADNPAHMFTLRFTPGPFPTGLAGRWAEFSSRGPNVDLAIKPDLSAAGAFMYSATQTNNDQGEMYDPTGYTYSFDGSCLENGDPPCLDGTSFSAPLVSGAVALLKAARPGLTSAQYRSLLVNSVSPVVVSGNKQAGVQTAGAGNMNVAAAFKSTVAVSPVSLSFGAGAGTVDASKDLTLTNLGTSPDTLTISVVPLGDGPAPVVDNATVQMASGASQKVSVRLNASSLKAGEYQGWLHILSSQTKQETVVAYWYAVPDHLPRFITTINLPFCGMPGSAQKINFRVTDLTGFPVPDALPTVVALSGGGRFVRLDARDELSPGLFVAEVRLGALQRANSFEIDLGDLTPMSVDIEANNSCP